MPKDKLKYLFYKDKVSSTWKYLLQQQKISLNFINPLSGYKIKQIYCSNFIVIWYYPRIINGRIDQKVVIMDRKKSIETLLENIIIPYGKFQVNQDGAFHSDNNIATITFAEPIKWIKAEAVILLAFDNKLVVLSDKTFSIKYSIDYYVGNFIEYFIEFNDIKTIYLGKDRVFVHTKSNTIICRGNNSEGQLGINEPTDFSDNNHYIVDIKSNGNSKLANLQLYKIACGKYHTLFWYIDCPKPNCKPWDESAQSKIYIAGVLGWKNNNLDCSLRNVDTLEEKIYDVQSHYNGYVIVYKSQIQITFVENSRYIKYETPIQKVYFGSNLYVLAGKIFVYKIYKFLEEVDLIPSEDQPARWFNTLPFADEHWDILSVLFAGHYKCPDSPLSKTKLPMDLLKIIINALIDLY